MNEWEKFTETDRAYKEGEKDFDDEKKSDFSGREYGEDFKEEKEKDLEDMLLYERLPVRE